MPPEPSALFPNPKNGSHGRAIDDFVADKRDVASKTVLQPRALGTVQPRIAPAHGRALGKFRERRSERYGLAPTL